MNRNLAKLRTHCQREALTPRNPQYREWIFQYTTREIKKDAGKGDITSLLLANKRISARIVAKEKGTLAGMQEIKFFLKHLRLHCASLYKSGISAKFFKNDGDSLAKGQPILELQGRARGLMQIERAILNLIGRMSGIATMTARLVARLNKQNALFKAKNPSEVVPGNSNPSQNSKGASAVSSMLLTPTRKTLWGLLDKRACVLGGGGTHRLSLDNAILIKHNHIKASGVSLEDFLRLSLKKASRYARFFEVEVKNAGDALKAAEIISKYSKSDAFIKRNPAWRGCVLFDNMSPREISSSLKKIKSMGFYNDILFEASGNITEKNLAVYAKTGVDILSLGMLTHSAPMLDVSMRVG